MASGTIPTQIRFTDMDKAKILAIQERFGLPSMASAVRYSIESTYRGMAPEKSRKKSGVRA